MELDHSLGPTAAARQTDERIAAGTVPPRAILVRVAKTTAEVETLREVWTSWKGHRDTDIDFCMEFVWSREEVIRPHVIVIYRCGSPDAILVGRLERMQIKLKTGYLRGPGIPVRVLIFAYGGLRGNPSDENSARFLTSIMGSLRQGEADLAFFHQACADSSLYKMALTLPGFGMRDHIPNPAPHHFMRLPERADQLTAGLSSKHREHLRSEARKLLSDFDGRVNITCFLKPTELDDTIRDVEGVAKKTYQRGLGVGFEDTPRTRQLLHFLAQKGWLRIYLLYIGRSPCAFSVGSVSDGVYCCDLLGYDPEFAEYSPGSFLLIRMFEDLCKAGVKEVDFGPGGGMYKERFGNRRVMEASISIFAPSLKGLMLNIMQTATRLMDDAVRKMLVRTGLLSKAKRLWRVRLTGQGLRP